MNHSRVRAARINAYGEPPEPGQADLPEPGPGQVPVTVELAGLNPVDIAIASGNFDAGAPELPYTPGLEGIGLTPDGSRVWFNVPVLPVGSFSERCVIDEARAIKLPDGVEPSQAVPFGVAGMAAWLGLEWRGQLKPGETVLILGAGGTVGQIAIQAARLLGAGRIVAATRSKRGQERSLELGADLALGTDGEAGDLAAVFREATEGGADLVLDGLWGTPAEAALSSIADGGRLVQVGNSAGSEARIKAGPLRGGLVSIVGHRNFHAPHEIQAEALKTMCSHAIEGRLEVGLQVFPLERVAEAWLLQQQSPGYKLALAP
ncbi:MAG: zinc-binding alcohol dehydrogenase family protein [Solirubrobacterales bacterium]